MAIFDKISKFSYLPIKNNVSVLRMSFLKPPEKIMPKNTTKKVPLSDCKHLKIKIKPSISSDKILQILDMENVILYNLTHHLPSGLLLLNI